MSGAHWVAVRRAAREPDSRGQRRQLRPLVYRWTMRVILEVGKKRRVVAAAVDWPGLDRWGTSEDDAIRKLVSYVPRYRGVAERAGMASEFDATPEIEVVERVPGSSSTDFWGIAHVPSELERAVLPPDELERRLRLLQATWAYFEDVGAHASPELKPGPRSAGRTRDQIIRHVLINEPEQHSLKVEVRIGLEVQITRLFGLLSGHGVMPTSPPSGPKSSL